MKVGYVGYSKTMQHPADRRRIGIAGGVDLNTDDPLQSDLIVLSNDANLSWWIKRATKPVILDIVDGYLGESPSLLKDALRNIVRSFAGKSSFRWVFYTRHLKFAAKNATAIVVGSKEQREVFLPYNRNVFVIPDDHSELDTLKSPFTGDQLSPRKKYNSLFWEGYGYTFKHFKHISKDLDSFLFENNYSLDLVTTPIFHKWGGYVGKVRIQKLIEKWFPLSNEKIKVIPWSLENLITTSSSASFGLIPINPKDKFARLKPENKLISMWRLGLVTLTSEIPSYVRVGSEAKVEFCIVKDGEWKKGLNEILLANFGFEEIQERQLNYVHSNYSKDILQKRWLEVFEFAQRKIS